MAIIWGPAVGSGNQFRVGIEFSQSPSTLSASTGSVTVTAKLYLQSRYTAYQSSGADWSMSMTGTTASSGSQPFSNTAGGEWSASNISLIATKSRTLTPSYTSTTTTTVSASVGGVVAISGTASVTASWTTAKRPVSAPAAPTAAAWSRTSDTQHTVTWSNTSPTSAGAPYTNVQVERSTNGGAWARIATVGVVASYTDKGTVANRQYQYRVRATNTAGASGYSTTSSFQTTPAAPTNVVAKKNAAGGIGVVWTDMSAFNSHFEVWHAANGVWDSTPLATITNSTPLPYVHAAPSASVTHTYRVRSKTATPVLLSAYSGTSNTVALLAAPNAPTPLAPVSTAVDANDTIAFSWQHNPVDTTDQRQYEFQYRVNGGAWGGSGVVTSPTEGGVIAGGTLENGGTLEWQVRTWGDHPDPSPWTALATVQLSTAPTVLINSPDPEGLTPYPSSRVTVTWGYNDIESNPQARWQATLYNGAGDAIEVLTGSGEAGEATFATSVTDGDSYSAGVKAQDSTGVWSGEHIVVFTVEFAKPPIPHLRLEWIPDSAAVAVAVTNPPTSVGEADVETVQVWRSVNGADWVLIADGLQPDSSTTDFIPGLGVVNYYKAVAKSTLPSVSESLVEEIVTDQARAVWVNAGPGFSQAVRLASNVKLDKGAGRAKTKRRTAGLEYPLENAGQQRTRTASLTARLWQPTHPRAALSSTWDELVEVSDQIAPACIRDPEGYREFVSLGDLDLSDSLEMVRGLTWSFERVHYAEPTVETFE